MCIDTVNKVHTGENPEKKYRLADFFNAHWDTYTESPKEFIQPEQYKAVNSIRICRTAALGVDIYKCHDCGDISEIYNSCKNHSAFTAASRASFVCGTEKYFPHPPEGCGRQLGVTNPINPDRFIGKRSAFR